MIKCIVCDSTDHSPIYNNTLTRCNKCTFITSNIEMTNEQLKTIYCEKYFNGSEYLNYLSDKITIQKNFSERLKEIPNRYNDSTKMNALEIGCAYGFFGEVFTKKFVNASYSGIDIVPEAIDYGSNILGLNLHLQNYLTFTSVDQYTHIFMWDVIEHLEHPDLFLEKISREMVKNGELHISTGDINALLPRIQKQKWRLIHPPSHLHYFSKNTLTALLKKYDFNIKCVKYKPVYRSVRQIFYSLLVLNRKGNKLISNLVKHIPEKWCVPLNTYDIMYIIALRK